MKVRAFVGLSAVTLVIMALVFCAKTFTVVAQDPLQYTPPGQPPFAKYPVQEAVVPIPAAQQPSLPELIANLKELRKQEQQLTKAIKEKIKAEKKSLDDAEKELNSLGIDTKEHLMPQPTVPFPVSPVPTTNPPVPAAPVSTTNY